MSAPQSFEDPLKRIHLIEELDMAVNLTKSGVALLQRSRPYRTQHPLFFLALSMGLERLMKVRLSLQALDSEGRFLMRSEHKAFGHDLLKLRGAVAERCFAQGAPLPEAIEADRAYFMGEPILDALLSCLGDFAMRDRFVYLEGSSGSDTTDRWLGRRWEEIEGMTMDREESLQMVMDDRLDEFVAHAHRVIVGRLERFLRALARTVTHTGLGSDPRSLGTSFFDFLMIRDEDFGARTYEVINT